VRGGVGRSGGGMGCGMGVSGKEGGRGGKQTKRESRGERGQERLRVKLQCG